MNASSICVVSDNLPLTVDPRNLPPENGIRVENASLNTDEDVHESHDLLLFRCLVCHPI